jgi:hypothetical protein
MIESAGPGGNPEDVLSMLASGRFQLIRTGKRWLLRPRQYTGGTIKVPAEVVETLLQLGLVEWADGVPKGYVLPTAEGRRRSRPR